MSYADLMRLAMFDGNDETALVRFRHAIRHAGDADAEISALTEKLRAVEAEQDEALREMAARGKDINDLTSALEYARAGLSALRAELERKDAALVDANKNIHMLYDLLVESDAPTKQYDYSTRKKSAIIGAMKFLAALQPKDKPCQTA